MAYTSLSTNKSSGELIYGSKPRLVDAVAKELRTMGFYTQRVSIAGLRHRAYVDLKISEIEDAGADE